MLRFTQILASLLAVGLLVSCESTSSPFEGPPTVDVEAAPPESLSELQLFLWDPGEGFVYNERVVPYELNTPLFSDYALKERAIYVPEGETMGYDGEGVFSFPVGSVIVKTFYFAPDMREPLVDRELIETRVLMHTSEGWEAWPYIWNEEQTDAVLSPSGATRALSFIDPQGEPREASYLVPQRNQCSSCHVRNIGEGGEAVLTPIGPAARHLNRDLDYGAGAEDQLAHFLDVGILNALPAMTPAAFDFRRIEADGVDAIPAAEVDFAARSYLDANCAHCHSPEGTAGVTSQLFLNHDNEDDFRLGVCKRPGSAGGGTFGRTYDLVPGDPEDSILYLRVETEEVGAMMPQLGRSVEHTMGSALLYRWIAEMEPVDCGPMMPPPGG